MNFPSEQEWLSHAARELGISTSIARQWFEKFDISYLDDPGTLQEAIDHTMAIIELIETIDNESGTPLTNAQRLALALRRGSVVTSTFVLSEFRAELEIYSTEQGGWR